MNNRLRALAISIFVLAYSSACGLYSTPTLTATPTNTATVTPFHTLTESATPTTTVTLTPSPSNTPPIESYTLYGVEFPACELPCIWGIIPGVSHIDELCSNVAELGTISVFRKDDGSTHHTFHLGDEVNGEINSVFTIVFNEKEGIVDYIILSYMNISTANSMSRNEYIASLGKPSNIFLASRLYSENRPSFLGIVLYEQLGVGFRYSGNVVWEDTNPLLCLQEPDVRISLVIGHPEIDFQIPFWDTVGYWNLNKIYPDYDLNDFPLMFEAPSTDNCIQVLSGE